MNLRKYIKQAVASIKAQPLVSWVSIAGTALAIFMIMMAVMSEDIQIAPYAPESNRDRWLVVNGASIYNEGWDDGMQSNGGMGYNMVRQVLYAMETPEAVGVMDWQWEALLSDASGKAFGALMLGVDDGFWKVMDFTFISGKPFDKGEFESGKPVAIMSETTAKRLFGTSDAAGRELRINHVPYTVKGVVRDVSTLANQAYSEVWVPYTANGSSEKSWCEYMGNLHAVILPHSKADIPEVKKEYRKQMAKFEEEAKLNGWKFELRERPYDQETSVATKWVNMSPDMASTRRVRYFTWAILLLVPAVNLSSMTHSRLTRRREEIGVRRAFGATRGNILTDLFIENLLITIVAGIIGLALSVVFAFFGAESVFAAQATAGNVTNVSPMMLLSWKTFGLSLVFCLILNILSVSLPALQAARTNVVNALSGKN